MFTGMRSFLLWLPFPRPQLMHASLAAAAAAAAAPRRRAPRATIRSEPPRRRCTSNGWDLGSYTRNGESTFTTFEARHGVRVNAGTFVGATE